MTIPRGSTGENRNALSWWLPRIEAAGVPVPRTVLVEMTADAREAVWSAFDGEDRGDMRPFLAALRSAGDVVGWPMFLRTDHVSGKHDWKRTCHVPSRDVLPRHVMAIAEYSEMADWFGNLPYDVWAAREFLPTMPVGTCPRYGDMPVCREFRFFVDEGKVRCRHPYWPRKALLEGGAVFQDGFDPDGFDPDGFDTLSPAEEQVVTAMAETAGRAVGGSWSVDVLETRRGWFVTDMALAAESFHQVGCPKAHDAPNKAEDEPAPVDPADLLA